MTEEERSDLSEAVARWADTGASSEAQVRAVCAFLGYMGANMAMIQRVEMCHTDEAGNKDCKLLNPGPTLEEQRGICEKAYDACSGTLEPFAPYLTPQPRVSDPNKTGCSATVGELRACVHAQRHMADTLISRGRELCKDVRDPSLARDMTTCMSLAMKCPGTQGG